ncbi:gluconeogenesis factor YvcK family protein [Tepidanaerobacter syntrophicus]|nr:gluconeogenesis factor YvcK family protein [Tepidanaerobacter syntrophicus]
MSRDNGSQGFIKKGNGAESCMGSDLNIVCLGGGTGLPNLLRGLKPYSNYITAIVTMADDGGSSGVIRSELKMPPPGDIRNCLLALAYTEPLMERLFQYRFSSGTLKGHSFGNLFIAAMTEMLGNFELAIKESSKILAVKGTVLPSTLEDVVLEAVYEDGDVVRGQSFITHSQKRISQVMLRPADAKPLDEALEAIEKADLIVLGPGSLYTSLIPNLLVKDITEAIVRSKAKKVYVVNVMTQPGETPDYKASDHVKAVIKHSHPNVMEYVIINTGEIPEEVLARYKAEGSTYVECDKEVIEAMGYKVVTESVVNTANVAHHHPEKLSQAIMKLVYENSN